MLTISEGNRTKLGKVANVSTRPGIDCGDCSACFADCYARKAFRAYPSVKKAWTQNGQVFERGDYASAWTAVTEYVEAKLPPLFRIHVSGDFATQGTLDFWLAVAWATPATHYLAYTKAYGLDYTDRPENLQVVWSIWPGVPDTAPTGPRAWVDDGTEDRIPADAVHCQNRPHNALTCTETCKLCWQLDTLQQDVVFPIH